MRAEPLAAANRRILVEVDDKLMPGVDAEPAQVVGFKARPGKRLELCCANGHDWSGRHWGIHPNVYALPDRSI
jgi:hypothetical protein